MARAVRLALAVLAGAAVWAVLWNAGSLGAQAIFPEVLAPDRPITETLALLGYIAYSVVLSVLAGFVTAVAAGREPMRAVWALAALQLGLGVVFEISYWSLMPVWYHLIFLALIVPATVYGGVLRARRRGGVSQRSGKGTRAAAA